MSKFTVINNRFKKDNKVISKDKVKEELNKYQFKSLLEKGKYTTRDKKDNKLLNTNKIVEKSSKHPKNDLESELELTKKDISRIKKVYNQYRVVRYFYKNKGILIDLMRKDSKFGFERFCCHLKDDSEDSILKGIKFDLEKQKKELSKVYNTIF